MLCRLHSYKVKAHHLEGVRVEVKMHEIIWKIYIVITAAGGSVELSHSLDANGRSASHEVPLLLFTWKLINRV